MQSIRLVTTLVGVLATGCAGAVEVTQTYTPAAAAQAQSEKFVPVAVVRSSHRTALPKGTRVEATRVVLPHDYSHTLAAGEVLEQDEQGRIVAVRSPGNPPVLTRFVPGTAVSPRGSDEVRAQLTESSSTIPLSGSDSVVMHGRLEPDDTLPSGAHVESSRSTGALVAGLVVFAISYLPTAYVGGGSPRAADRVLMVPVAGPWIDLANRPTCVAPVTPIPLPVDPCIAETASRVALVTSGALQGLATVLTVIGLPSHSRIVEGDVGARSKPRVGILPTPNGAAAIATF